MQTQNYGGQFAGPQHAQNQLSAATARRETAMEDIRDRVLGSVKTLDLISERLHGILGRSLGEPVEGADANNLRPVRAGQVGTIVGGLEDIDQRLSGLQALCSRLETLA